MSGRVLLVGATSPIASALAVTYAISGHRLALAARDTSKLRAVAQDLRIRHRADVRTFLFDAHCANAAPNLASEVLEEGTPSVVFFAVGSLGDPEANIYDPETARNLLLTNYQAAVDLIGSLLPALERQSGARLGIIGSVAGDRGRSSNFIYGATKSALHTYAQGLRMRLFRHQVSVTTVKLGYVDTRMTWGVTSRYFTLSPEQAATRIRRALDRRRDVVYVPAWWYGIMILLQAVPEAIWKRFPEI